MTRRGERRALLAILVGSALLFGLGIGWGLPYWRGWDFDELTPNFVVSSLERGVAKGWLVKYPPLQFYLLAPLYLLVAKLAEATPWSPSDFQLNTVHFYLSRGASVVMGVATVLLTFLAARRLVGARAALYGALVVAFHVPMVFYAKLGNLDVPYLFWVALSFLLLLRLLERQRPLDYLLVAVAAAAAVATKDQAYGVYTLAPLVLLPALAAARQREGRRAPWLGAVADVRPWIALLAGAGAFALAHGLLGGPEAFLAHYRKITGGYSGGYRMFEPTLAGHWGNFRLTARNAGFAFGWPLLAACLAGIGLAFARPRTGGGRPPELASPLLLATPLVLAASYYLTFVSVILYQYDRYFLPWAVLLAPFGGLALARLERWPGLPARLGAVAVAAALAWSGWRALALDLHLLRDARYAAEAWLAANVPAGDSVMSVGDREMLPRVEENIPWRLARRDAGRGMVRSQADWLVVNPLALWEKGAPDLLEGLRNGHYGYRLARRVERPLPFDPLDRKGITSSLYFVNPPIEIFRRLEPAASPRAAEGAASADRGPA